MGGGEQGRHSGRRHERRAGAHKADVGFAIGSGADVVLMKSGPFGVVGTIDRSRVTQSKMHENSWRAVSYGVVAFPFAAGVSYPLTISLELAAIAMSGSSLIVSANAPLPKRTNIEGLK